MKKTNKAMTQKNNLSAKKLIYLWLRHRQSNGNRLIRNSDMPKLRQWAKKTHNVNYNSATYERKFRIVRSEYPHRFEDKSNEHPDRGEKTWMIRAK